VALNPYPAGSLRRESLKQKRPQGWFSKGGEKVSKIQTCRSTWGVKGLQLEEGKRWAANSVAGGENSRQTKREEAHGRPLRKRFSTLQNRKKSWGKKRRCRRDQGPGLAIRSPCKTPCSTDSFRVGKHEKGGKKIRDATGTASTSPPLKTADGKIKRGPLRPKKNQGQGGRQVNVIYHRPT